MKISCDFRERVRITRNKGKEIVVIEPSSEGCWVVICFTLMAS